MSVVEKEADTEISLPSTTDAVQPLAKRSLTNPQISSILHPSHGLIGANGSENEGQNGENVSRPNNPLVFSKACHCLGVSADEADYLIDLYMSNITAFSLFHKPSFQEKINNISSHVQLAALLSAMFTFSAKFAMDFHTNTAPPSLRAKPHITSGHFEKIAIEMQKNALEEYGDSEPSLSLLQACILTAFQYLIRGVRGTAWRYLGTCIRIAYELDLHRVDSVGPAEGAKFNDLEKEEKRRAWWALWEMDTFASTIRRSPTAIDWSENETLLPIKDDFWYYGTPQASCFLATKPMSRWKDLQKSGNEACKAWFIVVNSLMRDAQALSDPRGQAGVVPSRNNDRQDETVSEKLTIISNSLRCFALALPKWLQYHGQNMSFTLDDGAKVETRNENAAKHGMYLMVQLTHLMVDHYQEFRLNSERAAHRPPAQPPETDTHQLSETQGQALSRFVLAADNIFKMVSRCSDDHVPHVNPFFASTIWIAAAVHLVQKHFGGTGTNVDLADSKFEFFRMNYQQYVKFWNTPSVLEERLEALERQLERMRRNGGHSREGVGLGAEAPREENPNQTGPIAPSNSQQSAGRQPLQSLHYFGSSNQFNEMSPESITTTPLLTPHPLLLSSIYPLSSIQPEYSFAEDISYDPVTPARWNVRGRTTFKTNLIVSDYPRTNSIRSISSNGQIVTSAHPRQDIPSSTPIKTVQSFEVLLHKLALPLTLVSLTKTKMAFTVTRQHLASIFELTSKGEWGPFLAALDPEVRWWIGADEHDPASKTGIYNVASWQEKVGTPLRHRLKDGYLPMKADHVDIVSPLKAIVEASGSAVQNNGKPYHNRFAWFLIFSEETGKIVEIREYMNTELVKEVHTTN
ncbi:hypothetical protein G7Y89_g6270 [Cudoniella acicularis]|uniref:Xylanolytic transcriptional activator regulatory domain-containing protein n=1 Tax=Cudoniella acicularis TaxID=354080 RepID=A0A8H4W5P2_9HELO|nr:hypothetical protein G7Y89_g6270 [Cudoniella acicularis]